MLYAVLSNREKRNPFHLSNPIFLSSLWRLACSSSIMATQGSPIHSTVQCGALCSHQVWKDRDNARATKKTPPSVITIIVTMCEPQHTCTICSEGTRSVDRYTSPRHFSHAVCTIHFMHVTLHGSSVCVRASFHPHAIHERLIVRSLSVSSCLSFSCFSLLFSSSLPYLNCTLTCTSSPMSAASRELTTALSHNEGALPPGDIPSSHTQDSPGTLARDFPCRHTR